MLRHPARPYSPGQTEPVTFVMRADDCLLHFEEGALTPRQQADHQANIALTAMLQVALLFMGRSKDHLALHDRFLNRPWEDALRRYQQHFAELLGDVIPLEHLHYYPNDGFYEAVAEDEPPTPRYSLYMVSGSNLAVHQDREAWALSQRVNSKMHFAATAPAAGLPVPETLVCTKRALGNEDTRAFFRRHSTGVMIKLQGLAGARNVAAANDIADAVDYVAEFDDAIDVLLQERLDTASHTEMTVDLTITPDEVIITNVRRILFADGLWVGNYLSETLTLSSRQRDVCLAVGHYVRDQGYVADEGVNCGIDFFVHGDDITVIEINARWTGGLFPAHLLKRLGIGAEDAIAFIDLVSASRFDEYLAFIDRHRNGNDGFRFLPMGFSPFTQAINGQERIYVWQVVVGDFEHFQRTKNDALGAGELPTADLISLAT